jgi:NADH pyrophosphatase NudC (nudix superfamily)
MIGCCAIAKTIDIKINKAEMEDVRWVNRADVGIALERSMNISTLGGTECATPPPYAIAHHLIKAWYLQDNNVTSNL